MNLKNWTFHSLLPQGLRKLAVGKRSVNSNRLADLMSFVVGIEAFARGGYGDNAHLEKSFPVLRKFEPQLAEGMEAYLRPVAAELGIEAKLNLAMRPTSPMESVHNKVEFLRLFLPRAKSARLPLIRETFKGKAATTVMRTAAATDTDDPRESINLLAQNVPASGLQAGRKWLARAAEIMGVPPSETETLVAEAAVAEGLGNELRIVGEEIAASDPNTQDAADLEARRAQLNDQIDTTVANSADPDVIQSAAVAAALPRFNGHATEVGKKLGMDAQQEKAMMVQGKGVIAAGAGSGKTRVLAGKVVDTINRLGYSSGQIIATSFSKKSAAELKDRVRKYGGGPAIFSGGDNGFGTTHSIANTILKEDAPLTYGRPLAADMASADMSQSRIIQQAMKQVMMGNGSDAENYTVEPMFAEVNTMREDPVVRERMQDGTFGEAVIDEAPAQGNLSPEEEQFQEVVNIFGAIANWAYQKRARGPWVSMIGQLTRALEGKSLADLTPAEKDAVNTAASARPFIENWIERDLGEKGLPLSGPVYKIAAQGRKRKKKFVVPDTAYIYDKQPANQWFNLGYKKLEDHRGRALGPKHFATAITRFKADLMTPTQVWAREKTPEAAVYGAYQWLMKNNVAYGNPKDFSDMQLEAVKLLVGNKRVREKLQAKYKVLMVDEAQDLNRLQHTLFGLIAGYIDPETREPYPDGRMSADTFTYIGDDKQAIYEFQGATPDLFIRKSDLGEGLGETEGFDTKLITTNYRSGSAIVNAANRLIANNDKQIRMTCEAFPARGAGIVTTRSDKNHEQSAVWTADQINQMKEEIGLTNADDQPNFGIAVRTNAEAYAFGVELLKKGIPFRSKVNFFNDFTTKSIVHWLRLASAGENDIQTINEVVLNAHRAPSFSLGAAFNNYLQEQARGQNYLTYLSNGGWDKIYYGVVNKKGKSQRWRGERNVLPYTEALQEVHQMTDASPTEVLNHVLELKGNLAPPDFTERKTLLASLMDEVKGDPASMDLLREEAGDEGVTEEDIKTFAMAPIRPLVGLVEGYEDMTPLLVYIDKLSRANDTKGKKDDPAADDYDEPAVVIDTVHGWKGLEATHLYVPMPKGTFPSFQAEQALEEGDDGPMASERRLGYVALTRGKESVTVLTPETNVRNQPGGAGRFVAEACLIPQGAPPGADDKEVTMERMANMSPIDDDFVQALQRALMEDPNLDSEDIESIYFTEGM